MNEAIRNMITAKLKETGWKYHGCSRQDNTVHYYQTVRQNCTLTIEIVLDKAGLVGMGHYGVSNMEISDCCAPPYSQSDIKDMMDTISNTEVELLVAGIPFFPDYISKKDTNKCKLNEQNRKKYGLEQEEKDMLYMNAVNMVQDADRVLILSGNTMDDYGPDVLVNVYRYLYDKYLNIDDEFENWTHRHAEPEEFKDILSSEASSYDCVLICYRETDPETGEVSYKIQARSKQKEYVFTEYEQKQYGIAMYPSITSVFYSIISKSEYLDYHMTGTYAFLIRKNIVNFVHITSSPNDEKKDDFLRIQKMFRACGKPCYASSMTNCIKNGDMFLDDEYVEEICDMHDRKARSYIEDILKDAKRFSVVERATPDGYKYRCFFVIASEYIDELIAYLKSDSSLQKSVDVIGIDFGTGMRLVSMNNNIDIMPLIKKYGGSGSPTSGVFIYKHVPDRMVLLMKYEL